MPLFLPQPDSGPVYYFRQYFGALCILGVILLVAFGYDNDVMTNSQLTWAILTLSVLGLIFHELRPFKVLSFLKSLCNTCGREQRWENIVAEVERRQETEEAHPHAD